MSKILIIFIFSLVCFAVENVVIQFFGGWVRLNLPVVLVVFLNLYRGLRYSLLAAFFSGLFLDSFTINIFGLNIFSLMACAYLTTLVKRYLYQAGSVASRVLIVVAINTINVIIHFIVNVMSVNFNFAETFVYVILPNLVTTAVFANYCFEKLKRCASKLFA